MFGDPILQPRFTGLEWTRPNVVYNFVETLDQTQLAPSAGPFVSSAAGSTFYACYFQMNLLGNAAQYIALFDQYRIESVEVVLVPRINVNAGTLAALAPNTGLIYAYTDYDDTVLPTLALAEQRSDVICEPGYKPVHMVFKPHVVGVLAGAINALNLESPWLDDNAPATAHNGIKFVLTQTSVVQTWDALVRMHMQFRNKL